MSNLNSVKCSKNVKQNLETEKGVDISCDIVFNCTGLRPNTSLTKKIFGKTRYLKIQNVCGIFPKQTINFSNKSMNS